MKFHIFKTKTDTKPYRTFTSIAEARSFIQGTNWLIRYDLPKKSNVKKPNNAANPFNYYDEFENDDPHDGEIVNSIAGGLYR